MCHNMLSAGDIENQTDQHFPMAVHTIFYMKSIIHTGLSTKTDFIFHCHQWSDCTQYKRLCCQSKIKLCHYFTLPQVVSTQLFTVIKNQTWYRTECCNQSRTSTWWWSDLYSELYNIVNTRQNPGHDWRVRPTLSPRRYDGGGTSGA